MIANQLGQMMVGWADSLMVSRLGVVPLAACALANIIFHVFLLFGFGLISSVSISVSRAFGAKNHRDVGELFLSGSAFGLGVGVVMAIIVQLAVPYLHLLGQDPALIKEGRAFLTLIGWSIVPSILMIVAKDYSESLSRPWLPFWVMMSGVAFNVFFNWVFIFGNLGAPAMGLTGAGLATLIARVLVAVIFFALIFTQRFYAPYRLLKMSLGKMAAIIKRLFTLGWPTAFHLLCEVGLFLLVALMMGRISVEALAAHQVAMTCIATAFMVPLGLALALTVRVGQVIGAGERERVRPIVAGAVLSGSFLMLFVAILFIFGGNWLAGLFFDEEAVRLTATKILFIAGFFGFFDAAQIIGMGGLRGLADVRVPMYLVYITYWGITFPLAYLLGFHTSLGAEGVWWGLLIGFCVASAAIGVRLWFMSHPSRKAVIDTVPELEMAAE